MSDRIVRQNWHLKQQNFAIGGLVEEIQRTEPVDEQNEFDMGWNACLESIQGAIKAAYERTTP